MKATSTMAGLGRRPIPVRAGVGLRAQHHAEIVRERPGIAWFEAHSENYFGAGGAALDALARVAEQYPLSLHGVGLSLGSTDPLDPQHLAQLRQLVTGLRPALVSEHVSWGSVGGRWMNDLLPMPYTGEALRHIAGRISQLQDWLGRQVLVENVSSYLSFTGPEMTEWEFLARLVEESGCGLLLDINNIYVSAMNHGFSAHDYLRGVPRTAIQEMHLAGHSVQRTDGVEIRIDTHGAPVCAEVWSLYADALAIIGHVPTLIEWDTDIPPLATLVAEAARADEFLEARHAAVA
jgi:uncharacterized protein (UPF0276 family)